MEKLFLKNFVDFQYSICGKQLEKYQYPWQVIPDIKGIILDIGKKLSLERFSEVEENIWVSKEAYIDPSVTLTAPLIVDEGAEIRKSAFIRGSVIVGKNVVVGNSTELKNCILFDDVEVPHFNYVGDSILGRHAHLGAGAVTSNIKADRTPVKVRYIEDGESHICQTGLRKFGACLGDNVEVGCHSVLNPGTLVGKNSMIYPLSSIRGYIPSDCIYKGENNCILK